MKYLPVLIELERKRAVVVGGGVVAAGRVSALREAGALVTVISPDVCEAVRTLCEAGEITLIARSFRTGDLDGAAIVMAATDDSQVNEAVWLEARTARIPVNVADDPDRCDFIMPSVLRRGDLTVAVSTSGRSPALAVRLRQRIARLIGPEYGRMVGILDEVRKRVRERIADPALRKRIMYRLVDSDLSSLVRDGNDSAIERRIRALIEMPAGDGGPGPGIVYIVGAGPGDSGLITVRGLDCLRSADVVLHDRLIDKDLLGEVRPDAEVIDVGKRAGDQGRMQHFIEETMIARVHAGLVVCRLKGGDPFVFGRGGEEARALTEAGLPFEIVPGVTSATAVPAAAGIPVTYRGVAHSFLVMTGSRAELAGPGEWSGAAELLRAGGTVIVLMGLAHFSGIVDRLVRAGCSTTTPLAVISRGTRSDQEVWVTTLGAARLAEKLPPSPGVIILGHVVEERRRLQELRSSADSMSGSGGNGGRVV